MLSPWPEPAPYRAGSVTTAAPDRHNSPRRREDLRFSVMPTGSAGRPGRLAFRVPRRFDVPVMVVCPEFTPAQAQECIDGGDVPELARAKEVGVADIDSGHLPMVTKPAEPARFLAATADAADR